MKKILYKSGIILFVAVMLFGIRIQCIPAAADESADKRIEDAILRAVDWCRDGREVLMTEEFNEGMGSSPADWLAITFGRLGVEDDYEACLKALEAYVTEAYRDENQLSEYSSTEWHRISLAVLAMGGDPTCFGTDPQGKPINLIADGTYNRGLKKSLGAQGTNGWIWGLIALDAMRYEVPEGSAASREQILAGVLGAQEKDGGFGLIPGSSDVDMTGMALQALAPYYQDNRSIQVEKDGKTKTVETARAVDAALAWLSEKQEKDGGYFGWGSENAESTAQVLVALASLGIDPLTDERFIKGGNLLDALLRFQQEDGRFVHVLDGPGEDVMSTEQSLYALCALYRLRHGMRTLYDFRPEKGAQDSYISGNGTITELFPELNGGVSSSSLILIIAAALAVVLICGIIFFRPKRSRPESGDNSW